jgi:hypothetical protein
MLADIERIHGCLIIDGVCTSGEDAIRQSDQHDEGQEMGIRQRDQGREGISKEARGKK